MKRFSSTFVSFVLILAMLVSMGSGSAFATHEDTNIDTSEDTNICTLLFDDLSTQLAEHDEAERALEAYNSLSPEARSIFDEMLAIDPVTRAYHIENVDSSYSPDSSKMVRATQIATSLTAIVNQLTALGLPTAVVYSLEAVGAGIIAALADGPLPFGDLLLLVATAGAVVVIASNWSLISSKWTSIIKVFTDAFTSITTIIQDAFAEIKGNLTTYQNIPDILVNGNIATVAGVRYNCLTMVSTMTQSQKQQQYYVAILVGGNVYFDASKPISLSVARTIVAGNSGVVGIVATSQARALLLAQPSPIGPENHGIGVTGYYWHYHNSMHRNCHIWYI